MKRDLKGIQFRTAGQFSSVRSGGSEDKKECRIEGYATTFGEEYVLCDGGEMRIKEVVDAGAFRSCDMSDTIFQYDHEGRVFARVSNGTLELKADEHGLHVEADLSGTEQGRSLYADISGGYITRMSFGFTVSEEEWTTRRAEDGKVERLRTIKGVGKLYDVSAVSIPANDGTEISARTLFEEQKGILEAERAAKDAESRKMEAARLEAKYRLISAEKGEWNHED